MNRVLLPVLVSLLFVMLIACSKESVEPAGSGFIEADDAIISAETSGRILTRLVEEGDSVARGDTLVLIDPSRLQLELASAKAAREAARRALEAQHLQVQQAKIREQYLEKENQRITTLAAANSASQQQLDKISFDYKEAVIAVKAAKTAVARSEAELTKIDADIARIERNLTDCYPLAPFNGHVLITYADAGELAAPGKPLIKLADLDTVWVKVYLPSGKLAGVRLGDSATVSTESGERSYQGYVAWTSDEAEFTPKNVQTEESRADLVYAVKVRIPNPDRRLKIGMPVYVTIHE